MNGQIGADLLAFVPPECQDAKDNDSNINITVGGAVNTTGGPELADVLECIFAPSNFIGCLSLVSVLDPELIPDPSDILECADIEDPYCIIEAECEPCSAVVASLMRCIVVHSEGVDANITELVETCPFDCSQ